MSCTRLLATMVIAAVFLLAGTWVFVDGGTNQNAESQTNRVLITRVTRQCVAGNMTSSMMMRPDQNITSSINLMNIIHQVIESKVNVSLSNATTTAEESLGNNSHAVAAHIDEHNGYLVYNVMVIDPSMNFSKVVVDPGNGDILLTEQISKEEQYDDVCNGRTTYDESRNDGSRKDKT